MYGITGVPRPLDHAPKLSALADLFTSVAAAATEARSGVAAAANEVLAANEGYVAELFGKAMSGPRSAPGGLEELATAATRTAHAHRAAAAAAASGLAAMDACAMAGTAALAVAARTPGVGASQAARVIAETRTKLLAIERTTCSAIDAAYGGLTVPPPLVGAWGRVGGRDVPGCQECVG